MFLEVKILTIDIFFISFHHWEFSDGMADWK